MSMQELTDDQLDGLFRKSAEEFNPPHDPVAWQAMSQLLDAHNQTVPAPKPWVWKKNSIRGFSLLLLLLLSAGGWLAYRQLWTGNQSRLTNRNSSTTDKIARPAIPSVNAPLASHSESAVHSATVPKPATKDNIKPIESTRSRKAAYPVSVTKKAFATALPIHGRTKQSTPDKKTSDEEISVPTTNELTRTVLVNKKSGFYTNRIRNETIVSLPGISVNYKAGRTTAKANRNALTRRTITSRPTNSEHNRSAPASRRTASSAGRYAIKQQSAFSNRQFGNRPSNNGVTQTIENGPVNVNLPVSVTELARRTGQWPKRLSFTGRELILPDTGDAEFFRKPSEIRQPRQTGLGIRLVVAPDLSVIGLKDFQRPGTNVGMMLEYRLNPRWSVQTGVLQSTKIYKSNTLPAYTQKWMVQPESVSGQCKLLDIPLNLRYDMAFRPDLNGQIRGRWFVSGGLTSYILWQEDYVYNYADPTSPHIYDSMRGWHGRTGWNGFSQLNLSAGYERTLGHRLSWQVEPFLKIPLKGVGYYKIDLLSTGAFLSLRYKF